MTNVTIAMSGNSKIKEVHLKRRAAVYIRQSSGRQVLHNQESQRLQYALKAKAVEWGWSDVEIIDCDLGISASVGNKRVGFDGMTAAVALGEVGIIFSREASRLSRTDKDWARLFEVCSLFDTLISDGDQIYDSNCADDQLILGIRAAMSVAELRTIRIRLVAGMENKAKRGEFQRALPAGYIWDSCGKVVIDPDARVKDAIDLVFKKFREIQSIRQTHLWFHAQNIELPVHQYQSPRGGVTWQLPKQGCVHRILKNHCFAGVYVWGRDSVRMDYVNGNVVKRRKRGCDARKSKVFLEGNHPGYITIDEFEENQILISKNCLKQTQTERVGAARDGQGLLGGILRCGRCGRKIYVVYYGKSGTASRYICRGDYNAGGRYCIAFGGSTVDKRFSTMFLGVISPFGVEASMQAAKGSIGKSREKAGIIARKISQLEYEVKRSFEQYNSVDPRNRLVASELEQRWNHKLEELESARKEHSACEEEQHDVSAIESGKILALGSRFADLWANPLCKNSLKKKVIRTVIEEVVVNLDDQTETLKFAVHWKGGCHTALDMPKPPAGVGQKTDDGDLDIIRKMAARYCDSDIARVLNRMGRMTATGKRWNGTRIQSTRGNHNIPGHTTKVEDPEVLTLGQAAKFLNVSETTVKNLVASGELEKIQVVPWAPWEIKRTALSSDRIRQIIDCLHRSGKLMLGGNLPMQRELFQDL